MKTQIEYKGRGCTLELGARDFQDGLYKWPNWLDQGVESDFQGLIQATDLNEAVGKARRIIEAKDW
jgi:hypothetical protein